MPNSKDRQTLQGYVDHLNGILNKTITDSRLSIITPIHGEILLITRYQNNDLLPLELKPDSYLHFRQQARVQSSKVTVQECRYAYSLSDDPDDDEAWILRYDYSLEPEHGVPCAHMHFNGTFREQQMRRIHFPTGRVSIEQIIAHLILEHDVLPKASNWQEVLAESHRGFTERRTDLESPLFP